MATIFGAVTASTGRETAGHGGAPGRQSGVPPDLGRGRGAAPQCALGRRRAARSGSGFLTQAMTPARAPHAHGWQPSTGGWAADRAGECLSGRLDEGRFAGIDPISHLAS